MPYYEQLEIPLSFTRDCLESEYRLPDGSCAVFTIKQAEGAMTNGTIIEKINSKNEDTNPDGTKGKIVGSFKIVNTIHYFVQWKEETIPINILEHRIKEVK